MALPRLFFEERRISSDSRVVLVISSVAAAWKSLVAALNPNSEVWYSTVANVVLQRHRVVLDCVERIGFAECEKLGCGEPRLTLKTILLKPSSFGAFPAWLRFGIHAPSGEEKLEVFSMQLDTAANLFFRPKRRPPP